MPASLTLTAASPAAGMAAGKPALRPSRPARRRVYSLGEDRPPRRAALVLRGIAP